ncbi:hypothetical protein L6R52_37430 [Myxococcota bacterium]|nr:hypothetical protein [Myxococcota bacterium]
MTTRASTGSGVGAFLRDLAEYQRNIRSDGREASSTQLRAKEQDLLTRQSLAEQAKSAESFQSATRFLGLALSVSSIVQSGLGAASAIGAAGATPAVDPAVPADLGAADVGPNVELGAELEPTVEPDPITKPDAITEPDPITGADASAEPDAAAPAADRPWWSNVELGVSNAKQIVEARLAAHDEAVKEQLRSVDVAAKVRDRLTAALRDDDRRLAELGALARDVARQLPELGLGGVSDGAPADVRPAVSARRVDGAKVLFSLENDNWLTTVGARPGSGFGAGDDFGLTHRHEVRLTLSDKGRDYLFGASSELYTRDTGLRGPSVGGKERIVQEPVEVSRLYFAVEPKDLDALGVRGRVALGLRNEEREVPGLAMWAQQRFHEMLPRAAVFENRGAGGMTSFLEAEVAARWSTTPLRGSSDATITAEAGATLNALFAGSRVFAVVEAEIPVTGALTLTAGQVAQLFAGQNVSFETKLGAKLDVGPVLVGVEAKLPAGDWKNQLTRFEDGEPTVRLGLEVKL